MERTGFVFYRSFYEAIDILPRDVQGDVYAAIIEYGLNGALHTEQLKPVARSIFALVKPQIDANNRRAENGRKGGRPRVGETETKPNNNQTITKPKPKDKDKDNIVTTIPDGIDSNGLSNDNPVAVVVSDISLVKNKPRARDVSATRARAAGAFPARDKAVPAEVLTWRNDYESYLRGLRAAYRAIVADSAFIRDQQKFHPGLNIPVTLEKACVEYWATPEAWEHKKKRCKGDIDWHSTLRKALSQPQNKVYEPRINTYTDRASEKRNGLDQLERAAIGCLLGN